MPVVVPPLGWIARDTGLPGGDTLTAVAFGAGGLAVTVGGADASVSTDSGTTWSPQLLIFPDGENVFSLSFGHGVFVGVTTGGFAARTLDGVTWTRTLAAILVGTFGGAVAYDSVRHVWVIMGGEQGPNNYAISTDDGLTWSLPHAFTNGGWTSVMFDGTRLIATGFQNLTSLPTLNLSVDGGSTWTEQVIVGYDLPPPPAIAFDGVTYMMGDPNTGTVRLAPAAVNLPTAANTPIPFVNGDTGVRCVATGAGLLVVAGIFGSLCTSADEGITWVNETTNLAGFANQIVEQGGVFIAVGPSPSLSTRAA